MIQTEIKNCLEFMQYVYGIFGYEFSLELSTRPEKKYLGDIATWDKAEKMIADALDAFGKPWKLNPGDGAFYGPKIGIV
jgi:threonyl-tRNA synthetase